MNKETLYNGKRYPLNNDYIVNENGTVFSIKHQKVISVHLSGKGYPSVSVVINNKSKHKRLSHMVLETYVGPMPKNKCAAHLDGNKYNNNLSNLAWVTHKENHAHKYIHGTALGGRNTRLASLTRIKSSRGVSFCKDRKVWVSSIKIYGKTITIGIFKKEECALAARKGAVCVFEKLYSKHYKNTPVKSAEKGKV